MIKCETIGMLDSAKVNPILTHTEDVANYSFFKVGDDVYLIANTVTGDGSYCADTVIPKGEYLNGYLLKAWEGQKLVIDAKHIEDDISGIEVNDTLAPQDSGKLKKGEATGVHLVVTDKDQYLTEKAVKAKVVVAAAGE